MRALQQRTPSDHTTRHRHLCLIQEVTDTRVPIMLCGNKVDMREALLKQGQTCITRQQGETLARDFGAHFQETSARTGQGMVEAIVELGRWVQRGL